MTLKLVYSPYSANPYYKAGHKSDVITSVF